MTKVFIGGSRRVSRLNADVRRRLDRIVEQGLPVVVGDANGADKAVQSYLHSRDYPHVEVFCSGDEYRNNVGGWPLRTVSVETKKRDFSFYAAKDQVMAEEATVGLMLWDGKSVGTLVNVLRLVRQNKPVVLYAAHAKRFTEIRTEDEWSAFEAELSDDLRRKVTRKADETSPGAGEESRQASLL